MLDGSFFLCRPSLSCFYLKFLLLNETVIYYHWTKLAYYWDTNLMLRYENVTVIYEWGKWPGCASWRGNLAPSSGVKIFIAKVSQAVRAWWKRYLKCWCLMTMCYIKLNCFCKWESCFALVSISKANILKKKGNWIQLSLTLRAIFHTFWNTSNT